MADGALSGIRILDLSRVLAGPLCTMTLGDLGAEVIKVEAPGGSDDTRHWGPPFQEGISAYYVSVNRNKKSLTVDLKTEEGRDIIKKLTADADVVIHNFKVGQMERWQLSFRDLKAINPRLIYCSITGFGQTGPYKDLPGYDFIIQAMSGLMSITGDEQSGPLKVGVAVTDVLTGLYAAIAIQAALLSREENGAGQEIDLSLYESAVSSLVNVASNFLMSGRPGGRLGNCHPNIAPYQTFSASDGEFAVGVGNDRQFDRFCEALELDKLPLSPEFSTNARRIANREALEQVIQKKTGRATVSHWVKALRKAGVPCGPIQDLEDVFNDPYASARGQSFEMAQRTAGTVRLSASPLNLSGTPVTYRHPPPDPGEHSREILTQAGYDPLTIDELIKNHIVSEG